MAIKRSDVRGRKSSANARTDRLPAAELDVMTCLWRSGEATARLVRENMLKYRPMAHGSVVTLLSRLEAKGMVTRQKGKMGKAFLFRPARPADATHRGLVKEMLRVFGGNCVQLISALFEANPPNRQELDEITALLNAQRRPTRSAAKRN